MKEYRTSLMLVHGIQGSPQQFEFLLEGLPESICVRNLLLPGHGASVREFRKSGREQWLTAVKDVTAELQACCDTICFVGHSMGCLLGLLTANEVPGCYGRMLLLCCPFCIRLTWRYIRYGYLAAQTKRSSDDPFILAAQSANSVKANSHLEYLTCIHPYAELMKLIRQVKLLRAVEAKADFIFAEKDEIVSPKSIQIAKGNQSGDVTVLRGCSHSYFTSEATVEMRSRLLKMLS